MSLFSNPVVVVTLLVWWFLLMYLLMLRCRESPYMMPCRYASHNTTTSLPKPEQKAVAPPHYEWVPEPGYACKQAYEHTIDKKLRVRFVAGKSVMMDFNSVQEMCELLGDRRDKDVLEWGSGGSTLFFSKFARSWVSFEHDARFGDAVLRYGRDHGMLAEEGGNVRVEAVPDLPDPKNINQQAALFPERYRAYTDAPRLLDPGRKYDIILNDGVAREQCAESVLRNQLLKPGGVLVIHDFERKAYHVVLTRGWNLVRLINTDRRHLAVLQPK